MIHGVLPRLALALAAGVVLALALALAPALATAADPSSYEGTYSCVGQGKDKKGKEGSSPVTVWVEDLGDTARFTFQVDKLGIVVDAEGDEEWDGDSSVTVALSISSPGVDAAGTVTLVKEDDRWTLTGDGEGTAGDYEGTGGLIGTRVADGFESGSLGEQISDMVSNMTGPPDTETKPSPVPDQETKVDPASQLEPAEAAPPLPTETAVGMSLGVFVLLLMFLFLL